MSSVFIDVTDLAEFLERQESVSGVQRVVVEVVPLLVQQPGAACVLLDRSRGVFVELTEDEKQTLIDRGVRNCSTLDRVNLANVSSQCLERARNADPVEFNDDSVLVFLGALWINDALMIAARAAHAVGARIVALLYDLTPILDAGHTAAVNNLFHRYLHLLLQCASRVPAISKSSREDFEQYVRQTGSIPPLGAATGLPYGLEPEGRDLSERPWPRPYALFVGTVESRKNHLLALRAWQKLIERHGEDSVPDLVCIGRLGWNSAAFLREYVFTHGLNGKLSVLSSSVDDRELARFYAHSDFTIYPSNYEGWGLPISESLAFGKVPVVARNSSLPEAGGDLAVYFETGNEDSLVEVVEANALNTSRRHEFEERIRTSSLESISWDDVASTIREEIHAADRRDPVFPTIELGREYMLSVGQPPPDEGYADQYLDHLVCDGLTPMLAQPRSEHDYETTDAAVIGTFGSPQTWGLEIRPGRHAEFRMTRPVDGRLTLLVSTRAMPGRATIQVSGPGGPVFDDVYLGSVITIPLGDGRTGEPAQALLSVTAAQDSIEGFLGICSFVVLEESDKDAQIVALQAAAKALRQELDFLQGTRSWKVTAPLRKWRGRGA
ncbi:glycosyltransferase family 4 protein [Candidatus Nanopelagicales bacterium]|nr:glycosyltransferase family 4 protein [Candidatus Nanopelagicales bacterium]